MQLPELKMEGRSGCALSIEQHGNLAIIKKISNSLTYNSRLIKQAKKQKSFFENVDESNVFTTANVFDVYINQDDLACFTMPYLFAEKYSDFLDHVGFDRLKMILNHILKYFQNNISKANICNIDNSLIENKIADLQISINNNSSINPNHFNHILQFLKNNIPSQPLPLGFCHGDFTFSNILFDDHKIYLLDFLDSFIESPIIDIVKLRQDTCYRWSLMIEGNIPSYKYNKLIQVFNFFDKEIEAYCNITLGMEEWYKYLQVFNFIRIVPYLYKENEIIFIKNTLKNLLK